MPPQVAVKEFTTVQKKH